jgi:isochorismate synthase
MISVGEVARRRIEETAARLDGAIRAAAARAARLRRPVAAWVSAPIEAADLLDLYDAARGLALPRALWMRPDARSWIVAIGSAWEQESGGAGRFQRSAAAWRRLVADAVGDGDPRGPIAVAGFAFSPDAAPGPDWDGFPSGVITLPAVTVRQTPAGAALTVSAVVDPHGGAIGPGASLLTRLWPATDAAASAGAAAAAGGRLARTGPEGLRIVEARPGAARWKAEVANAARAIRGGALRKVVLARQIKVDGVRAGEVEVIARLRRDYPGCVVFSMARGGRWFVGATPELLARVEDGVVTTGALAGSAPRGATEAEDRRLGERLLASGKDRVEHGVVVDDLRRIVDEVCTDVSVAAAPALLRIAHVQHLFTPITGRLPRHRCILDLVERLHPSPAVGGSPRQEALAWVREHEGLDRGWYAGPVGWIDGVGEGEFAVAIRCALVRGRQALLFAGCGIVADSDPELEYAESQLKLRSMRSALGGGAAGVPER